VGVVLLVVRGVVGRKEGWSGVAGAFVVCLFP